MDNRNTGKLIASLRKKLGMTQQELGDKVGVGFRAVSKWERGLNLPDIGNMNELSKILGITLDELLAGKLNDKQNESKTDKKKISTKIKITISIITAITLIFTSVFIYLDNKTYVYNIASTNRDEYIIKGQISFKGEKITIIINQLKFRNEIFSSTIIRDYEYQIISGNEILFGFGQNPNGSYLEYENTIENVFKTFRIYYYGDTQLSRTKISNNNNVIIMNFIDENNQQITKNIEFTLSPSKGDNQ